LNVPYIDSGAMYRAVGLAAREQGIGLPIEDPGKVAEIASAVRIGMTASPEGNRILLDGRDVSEEIRRPEISLYASAVSAIPAVRRLLVQQQQRLGRERGGVMEGRDIGTKVFPETPHKFFLTADASVRAQRRTRELEARGTPQPYENVLRDMEKRDEDDGSRADSPLTFDQRYVLVDSSGRPVAEVVSEIEGRVRGRI
jgi:cytidylate kinase